MNNDIELGWEPVEHAVIHETAASSTGISHFISEIVQKIQNWVNKSRVFYFLSRPYDSVKQLYVSAALTLRASNEALRSVVHIGPPSIYPTDNENDPFGIEDSMDQMRPANEGYYTFNLPTTHKVLGVINESHNVSVLYDAKNKLLYVIDGKASNPKHLYFQGVNKKPCKETVQIFVNYLRDELSVEPGKIAYCDKALQRTNDCVIFPEKVMADLIKNPCIDGVSIQAHLDGVLNQAIVDSANFYGEINALRNKCIGFDAGKMPKTL